MRRGTIAVAALLIGVAVAALLLARPRSSPGDARGGDGDVVPVADSVAPRAIESSPTLARARDGASSATSTPGAHDSERIRVHGRVKSDDGRPIAGANLQFIDRWRGRLGAFAETVTDAEGAYSVEVPRNAAVAIATAAGWAPGLDTLLFIAPTHELDFTLLAGRLGGTVVDGSGRRVAHVEISARDASLPRSGHFVDQAMLWGWQPDRQEWVGVDKPTTVRSDASGRFEFRGLSPGEYRLLSAAGAWFVAPDVVAAVGASDVVVTVVSALSLTARVLDAATRKPVDATIVVNRVFRTSNADGSITASYRGFPTRTRDGSFAFVVPAQAADDGETITLRVTPDGAEYRDAERAVPFDASHRSKDVEILLERVGLGSLVIDATTPSGTAFAGPLEVVLVAQTAPFAERRRSAVAEARGRFRVDVPAEREWHVWIRPALPITESGISGFSHSQRVNVRPGEDVLVRLVVPEWGSLRIRFPAGKRARVDPVDSKGGGSMILEMTDGTDQPAHGLVTKVTQGRWRVSVEGAPDTAKDVDVAPDAETLVDLR